jgi:hypothetical protein
MFSSREIDQSVCGQEFATVSKFSGYWIYEQLLVAVLDKRGQLCTEIVNPRLVADIRQVLLMFKKVSLPCPDERVKDAVKDFFRTDISLRAPSGAWSRDVWLDRRCTFSASAAEGVIDTLAGSNEIWNKLDAVCARLTPSSELDPYGVVPKHGPGAVSDARTGSDKYLFATWPVKLNGHFDEIHHRSHRGDLASDVIPAGKRENPAKLLAVPKTMKGPRLITAEPAAHQYIQQGVLKWLRRHLPKPIRTCIDFRDQSHSQRAALEASMSDELATIDLSKASDLLTCWTVERFFGSNQSLLSALHACRSRYVIDGTGFTDFGIELKKFAGMGSAVTFPVQSIVYAGIAIAAILQAENRKVSARSIASAARKVRVFGDDIIMPSSALMHLSFLLHQLEFKVNATKSHYQGHFRESCGMDAYKGYDVTPAYIRVLSPGTDADSIASWVEVSNNFFTKGLWKTARCMDNRLGKARRLIPVTRSDSVGIRLFSFCGYTKNGMQRRWNASLHRHEVLCLVPKNRNRKKSRGSYDDLLDYFLQAPEPHDKWSHGYIVRKSLVLTKDWVPEYVLASVDD